jgi:hypothetical protein
MLDSEFFKGYRLGGLKGRIGFLIQDVLGLGLDLAAEGADHHSDCFGDSDAVSVGGLEPFDVGVVEEDVMTASRFCFSSGHLTIINQLG